MTKRDITSRLASGERLLLDGGIGSELQRRGVDLSKGTISDTDLGAWSATAMGDAPDVVRAVHDDYLRVGADIITTNSFWTNRTRLGMVGRADKMEEYTRLSAEIAVEARDRLSPEALVAGSMAPPASSLADSALGSLPHANRPFDILREVGEQAEVLAKAGVDILLPEFVDSVSDCVKMVDAAGRTGLPVFLGICQVTMDGTMRSGERFDQLAQSLKGRPVRAVLAMCSTPESISASLPNLRAAFDVPVGAYANIGYKRGERPVKFPERQFHVIENSDYPPERYAEFGLEWLGMGAQIVGGCCASTPDHIEALRAVVKG